MTTLRKRIQRHGEDGVGGQKEETGEVGGEFGCCGCQLPQGNTVNLASSWDFVLQRWLHVDTESLAEISASTSRYKGYKY